MKNEVTNKQLLAASQRILELMEAGFAQVAEQFIQVDQRFEQVDARFEQVDARFEQVDRRFDMMGERITQVECQIEDLAMMTTLQFDDMDRKFSLLSARTHGFRFWL
jgi:chromosome segregation ATPase